ncbi:aminomethyltransferase family protein [Microbacterium sediminicola]|uniref:Aminomethyltransferase family protein n=1 Tax=Microbacterium sediminicola TaxID=415210 RepID=A0ABP4UIE7_9MICO
MSFADDQRRTYEDFKAAPHGAFITERPAYFSPAAAAQDATAVSSTHMRFGPMFLATEFTNTFAEARAHHDTAYIGDWSPLAKIRVSGADALRFLSWLGMNDLSRFEIGQIKHHVQLDENGYVAMEGILLRVAEEAFIFTAGSGDWLLWQAGQGEWDLKTEDITPDRFIFGIQGPASLAVLETLTSAPLRDIAFNRSRELTLAGVPLRVLRTGISGQLGYELHGVTGDGNHVWQAVVEAGAPFRLLQLGFQAMSNQHVEAGIATNGLDYLPSSIVTPGSPWQFRHGRPTGSFEPTAVTDFFRRPSELGWTARARAKEDDYLGRSALEAHAETSRAFVGLIWDTADVQGVFASLFDDEPADQMTLPRFSGPAFDRVQVAGDDVGVASGRTYSPFLRKVISFAALAPEHAAPGTTVEVLWGRPGTPQRTVRAVVTALPFIPDGRRVDVASLG